MNTKRSMTLVEHLTELRRRLIWILVILVLTMIIGLAAAKPIILFLKSVRPASGIELHALSPWDTIRIYLHVSFILALVVSLPFMLYQIWAFLKPGLKPHEQKAAVTYIPFAFLLFLAGLAFGYFVVFPFAFYFTTTVTESLQITETYGIAQYFSFMFNIMLPLAVLFELPVVVMFLTRLRVLNPKRLAKMRRYAYLLLVILGAMFTPPDAISAIIVSLPMILLYEFSVMLSGKVYRKQLEQDIEWEKEFG